jgi:curved DNA-binding protein CbpA
MIETCLAGPEYISAAKHAGIYPQLLSYVTQVRNGIQPAPLPGEAVAGGPTGLYRNGLPANLMSPPQLTGGTKDQRSQLNPHMKNSSQVIEYSDTQPAWKQVIAAPQQKALSYFSSCLAVLGIGDDETLTMDRLKQAYKKAAIRVHPDKGGSEQEFEAVTRSFAYLAEIMKRMQGRQPTEGPIAPAAVVKERKRDMKDIWSDDMQPVRIDPKNMNMQVFNQMFDQARIPDPDDEGYGDWLKGEAVAGSGPKFSGEFNREVFNKAFDAHVREDKGAGKQMQISHPRDMALTLSVSQGVELGRDRPVEYTSAPNQKTQFTDLRAAYTSRSTFSNEIADVRIENRDIKKVRAERESAPAPLSMDEASEIAAAEERWKHQEQQRARRAAEEMALANAQFERMKRLMIVNGTPVE